MKKKYGRWNTATYYPNCNRIHGNLAECSTEKMLYGDTMDIQVRNYYNSGQIKIGSFDIHVLTRVAASHGITRDQLKNFLLLQGLIVDDTLLNYRLYELVKHGYLSWIRFSRSKDDIEIILYDIAGRGVSELQKNELPCQNPQPEYFIGGDLFRFMRTKIISNQVALHLLCSHKDIRNFFFQREFEVAVNAANETQMLIPLYIQTKERNYIFEFAGNTAKGKNLFHKRMKTIYANPNMFPEDTAIVIVGETYSHMETLANEMMAYENRNRKIDVFYSYDAEWFNDMPGHFYAMARAMGQSGIIGVTIK